MKVALEWFLNPDHLPLIIAKEKGFLKKRGIENFEIIAPEEHYDGLEDLIQGNIELATNEPLHLIEQYHPDFLSLGSFFKTKGGVMMKKEAFEELKKGGTIQLVTPVSNDKTNTIGFEIIKRYAQKHGFSLEKNQVEFCAEDFYLIKHLKAGYDAAWLYFYNFEGIESQFEEDLDLIFMDADTAGFANFCALDLFTSKKFYNENQHQIEAVIEAIKEAILFITENPKEAFHTYYTYANEDKSELMDAILNATAKCFDYDFKSSAKSELPILDFFNSIGVSNLSKEKFETAFINP